MNTSLNILHIIPAYKPAQHYGGPTISVSRLAEEQARNQARVSVYTTTANGNEELDLPAAQPIGMAGVQVWYFRRWTGDHSHFSPALMMHLWKTVRPAQVIHLHSWWNWVAFGTALICRWQNARLVVSPRGMLSPFTLKSRARKIFQKTAGSWLLRGAVFHATSARESRELQQLHPQNRCVVLPNCIELPALKTQTDTVEHPVFQLLFLSRIDPKKGLDILINALSNLEGDWQLSIAGTGPDSYASFIKKQIATLELQENVTWLGWVDGPEKWRLLEGSDLLVLPSHNENFANVVLEALALGTPVLLSDQVGLSDYVEKQNLGWVCPPKAEPLRETLQVAMAAKSARQRIRQQAPAIIRRNFDPQKLATAYLDFYTNL
ncbi:MAG: glycosyltransferase [Lewinellaceae bacterium]|nr:glycosyltransferase [Lewinellaceae bacterium]